MAQGSIDEPPAESATEPSQSTRRGKTSLALSFVQKLVARLAAWTRATPTWQAFARDRILLIGFVLLSATALAPMVVTPFLPLTDVGFNGLAALLPHVLFGDAFLNEWYQINWRPVPYWGAYALQGIFSLLLGPTLAVKATVAVAMLLLPLGVLRLALAFGRDPRVALLAFILVWDRNLYWGWVTFQFGMGVCLWTLARLAEVRTYGQAFALWPLSLLVALTHVHATLLLAVAGGLICVSGLPFLAVLQRRVVALAAALLPVGSWLLSVLDRDARSAQASVPFTITQTPLAERLASLHKFTLDNYLKESEQTIAVLALLAVMITPLVLGALPQRTLPRSNRLLASLALFLATLTLYLVLPWDVSKPIAHFWTYARYATYVLLGALLLPQPDLSRWRALYLAPGAALAVTLHWTTLLQFKEFGQSVRPILEIQQALPEHQRFYPVSYETSVPSVPGFAVISLPGYLAMEKKAYNPHFFDLSATPLVYKKRLPQHHWQDPNTFRFEEHGKHYDYILIYSSRRDPLSRALKEGKVELTKKAGAWRLYHVLRAPG